MYIYALALRRVVIFFGRVLYKSIIRGRGIWWRVNGGNKETPPAMTSRVMGRNSL